MTSPEEKLILIPLQRVMGNMAGREDSIRSLQCISSQAGGCGRQIATHEILSWDELTIKEYRQSGWCSTCQDRIFKDPDECSCEWIDVLGPGYPMMPGPMNDMCPEHGDPDFTNMDLRFDYDPDMREDEPPMDINLIEWVGNYA